MFEKLTIPKAKVKEITIINQETNKPEVWYFCQTCGYGTTNEKTIRRHIKKHEKRILLTCGICGYMRLATKENFWIAHHEMRNHTRTHATETKDLYGEPISFGYAWTDRYVAVKQINSIEELEKHKMMVKELIKKKGNKKYLK